MLRPIIIAVIAVIVTSVCNATIVVGVVDVETGAEYRAFSVDSVETNGGTTILVERPSGYCPREGRVVVFTAEYAYLCQKLHTGTLAGHTVEWRVDNDRRCSARGLAGAIRLLVEGRADQVRIVR